MLSAMYEYFIKELNALPEFYKKLLNDYPLETVICDYLSGMTDRYAISAFRQIFIPESFN